MWNEFSEDAVVISSHVRENQPESNLAQSLLIRLRKEACNDLGTTISRQYPYVQVVRDTTSSAISPDQPSLEFWKGSSLDTEGPHNVIVITFYLVSLYSKSSGQLDPLRQANIHNPRQSS